MGDKLKFLVAGKWELDVVKPTPTTSNIVHSDTPYTWFVENKPYEVSKEIWCYEQLLKGLSNVNSVVEYFGGVGCDATLIDGMFDLEFHILNDLDKNLAEHLKEQFPMSQVYNLDFYDISGFQSADLVCLDFNSFTMTKLDRDDKLRTALCNALDSSKYSILTDTAIFHWWFHKKLYSKLSGYRITSIDMYLLAMSKCLYKCCGFSIVMAASHNSASYLLLQRGRSKSFDHVMAPKSASTSHFKRI